MAEQFLDAECICITLSGSPCVQSELVGLVLFDTYLTSDL